MREKVIEVVRRSGLSRPSGLRGLGAFGFGLRPCVAAALRPCRLIARPFGLSALGLGVRGGGLRAWGCSAFCLRVHEGACA